MRQSVGGSSKDISGALKALEIDNQYPNAWNGLAKVGGGVVAGQHYITHRSKIEFTNW